MRRERTIVISSDLTSRRGSATVTVVIPTYNSAAHLELAVRSALDQTLGDIEIIIVDDASTDQTVALSRALAEQDGRIRVEELSRNGGPAVARNRGLELARGRWFAVLDSDDTMDRDRLNHLVAVAEREGADLVADNLIVFDTDDHSRATFFLAPEQCSGWVPLEAYLRRTVLSPGEPNLGYLKPVMRVDSLKRAGLRYNPKLRIAEDDDLIVRLLASGLRYWLDPLAGYAYRRHPASTSYRLSVQNATAMVEAGAQLLAADTVLAPPIRAALAARQATFEKTAAFARLIEALKARAWARAVRELVRTPAIAPLLRMPLAAAVRRRLGIRAPTGFGDPSQDAAAALSQLLANRGLPI
ncbi:MAG: glycosyltransferase [Novosphingobium sp.]